MNIMKLKVQINYLNSHTKNINEFEEVLRLSTLRTELNDSRKILERLSKIVFLSFYFIFAKITFVSIFEIMKI